MPRSEDSDKPLTKTCRFFVSCYNVTPDFAKTFKISKTKGHGDFTVRFMEAAFNKETRNGEFFIEFVENIYEYRIVQCFQNQGAGQVYVMTFTPNDGSESASSALFRVRETAYKTGSGYVQGLCTRLLKEKTQNKWEAVYPSPKVDDFDVVKKRRRMDETVDTTEGEIKDSPDALAQFEDFEQAVMGALTRIYVDDQENIRNEMVQMEEGQTSSGGVYVAKCESLVGIVKIGATRRSDPSRRLWEISRYVPKPFQLVTWIPTNKPFSLEAQIHRSLATKRLKEKGAGTEFFEVKEEEIQRMLGLFQLSQ